ncbi:MAG TPA: FG-GAP-like repeat-containing protein [Methylomirabilota bacterium]|nr:FG-GAP-like repeat-containing protein [Methylomirabilota bacterium]
MVTRLSVTFLFLISTLTGVADAQIVNIDGPGRLEPADLDGTPVWVAANPGLGVTVALAEDGAVRLRSLGDEERPRQAGLRLVGWGPEGYGRPFPALAARAEGSRLRIERDGAFESLASDAGRVVQRLSVSEPPVGWDGVSPLELELELLDGCTARPFGEHTVQLLDGELGEAVADLRVDLAWDADGAGVDATLVAAEGRVLVRLDAATAAFPLRLKLLVEPPSWVVWGGQAGGRAGWAVATAGDVNGDGYSDVVVGSPLWDGGQTDEGRVRVYHGSATGLAASPAWSWEPNQAGAQAGTSVATAGDVNGDGYSDLIVGAPYADGAYADQGAAHVFHGSASGLAAAPATTLTFPEAAANFGFSVSSAGDVNGDGYSDVLVGAPGRPDVFVYHGSGGGLGSTFAWQYLALGTSEYDYGYRVALAGDVNGDGYSDILFSSTESPGGFGCGIFASVSCYDGRVICRRGSPTGVGDVLYDSADAARPSRWSSFYCYLGRSLAPLGDLDGDGYADFGFGGPVDCNDWETMDGDDESWGHVRVLRGSASGAVYETELLGSNVTVTGRDGLGASLFTAGDVNGDGYADLVLGAHDPDAPELVGTVVVRLGGPDGYTTELVVDPGYPSTGWAVSLAGDVNGDGLSDLVGGAPYADGAAGANEGVAFVRYGRDADRSGPADAAEASVDLDWIEVGEALGSAASWTDADNDGYDDLLVGAPGFREGRGHVRAYCGRTDELPDTYPCWVAMGSSPGDGLGTAVSAGDLDGDGLYDVVAGAPGAGVGGEARIYCGRPNLFPSSIPCATLAGAVGDDLGTSVAVVGDVNGDGFADLLVGAPGHREGANRVGAAYLWLGGADLVGGEPDVTFLGSQVNGGFGTSVAGAGDVNRDGASDLVIGARAHDQGGMTNAGTAYVYHGRIALPPLTTAARTLLGDQAFGLFGHSVASAGDVNGDGYADVVVGAPYRATTSYANAGRASVFLGSGAGVSTTASWHLTGDQAGALYGYSVSSAGDVNGDGYADLVVGAPGMDTGAGGAFVDGGRVVLAFGGSAGLGADLVTADHFLAGAARGRAVGPAGDVNGDGSAEVALCSPGRDSGTGRVTLWSRKFGPTARPRQLDAAGVPPIPHLGAAASDDGFTVALATDTIFGRGLVRLQTEAKPILTPFNGAGLQQGSSWVASGVVPTAFHEVTGLAASTLYHWRTRLLHQTSSLPLQPHGPWRTRPVGGWNEADLRTATTLPADLEVVVDDTSDPVVAGSTLEDLVTVTNLGPQPAASVVLALAGSVTTLPALNLTPSTGSCVTSPSVQCSFGNLSSGAAVTVLVRATPAAAGVVALDATVTTSSQDPDFGNNHAVETTTVVMPPGLEFTVTSAGDGADANPGNGVCATSAGECTLRAAVGEANALANADIVTIATPDSISVASSILITGNLTVRSGLGRRARITGNGSTRVFVVDGAYPDVTFERLDLVDGWGFNGSLVELDTADDVTFTDCRFAGGYADGSGAVAVTTYGGHLLFDRCDFEDNVAEGNGAAIYIGGATTDQRDTLEVRSCTFDGNTAGSGEANGGAISVRNTFWDVLITDSVFSHNEVELGHGGAIELLSTAGDVATARIERSSFIANRVTASLNFRGGAIIATTTHLHLVDCTFSGNSATASGGAIHQVGGELALSSCTIADNVAPSGGGISGASSPVVRASWTILSGNGANCSGTGTVTGDFNLSSDGSCSFSGSGNLTGTNPLLGPLGGLGSGGPLYRLQPGSPALDVADGIACLTAYGELLEEDQRASLRPEDGNGDGVLRCDRGAYEAHPGDMFSDSFESGTTSRWSDTAP